MSGREAIPQASATRKAWFIAATTKHPAYSEAGFREQHGNSS